MKKILLIFYLGVSHLCFAQYSVNSSGASISGSGGSIEYSVGQVFFTIKSAGFSVSEGVQQPYEITNLGVADNPNIKLEMMIYPNPTTADITLKINNLPLKNLSYQIVDQSGRKISQKEINEKETLIQMRSLGSGAYILVVFDEASPLKSFKIIKK